jgi:integrase
VSERRGPAWPAPAPPEAARLTWYATKALADSFRSDLLRAQRAGEPLKRRRPEDVRLVPIPPVLVAILRVHVATVGTAPDGRLFFGVQTGEHVPGSVYSRVWDQARKIGLSPEQAASPLARRPYDLRHAALSSWLAAGVPPTEVAERAGNSVKVLLTVYAKCLDDQQETYNERIASLLDQ